MGMWLYQIRHDVWPPSRFRIEIWEGERWRWPMNSVAGGEDPEPGDRVVFYYAKTGATEPGFYGWAVVLEAYENELYFRAVRPTDELKMHPWWDARAEKLADRIRGKMKQRDNVARRPRLDRRSRLGDYAVASRRRTLGSV